MMPTDVEYIPGGGTKIKHGFKAMVNPKSSDDDIQPFFPDASIAKTQSRGRCIIFVMTFSMLLVIGLFLTGVFWIWVLQSNESHSREVLEFVLDTVKKQQDELSSIKESLQPKTRDGGTALDVCKLPAVIGNCRGALPRWFHNSATGDCEMFTYGGCGSNGNNFLTKEECEKLCKQGQKVSGNPCELSAESGPCRAAISKFYFDMIDQKCKEFVYGGCAGNENKFNTLEDCEATCGPTTKSKENVCNLEPAVGTCRGAFPRWFFNPANTKCEKFIYGGCEGNGNNFESEDDCMKRCVKIEY